MKLILLGGNSTENISWLKNLESKLKEFFDDIYSHKYHHWEKNEPLINIDEEIKRVEENLKNIENYAIVGKSIGVLVALKGIYENKFSPQFCVFMGTPIGWARGAGLNFENWFNNFSIPTLFIQNSNDPAISVDELKNLLENLNVKNYKIEIFPRNDHEYNDFGSLSQLIFSFSKNFNFQIS